MTLKTRSYAKCCRWAWNWRAHPDSAPTRLATCQPRARGVLHKYQGRVLLITTGACGVNCRYCFRRHFPYEEETARSEDWREALDYLRADCSVNEVILSGGDPLSLTDRVLAELVTVLQQIPHINRLRIHTRQPIVLPSRVDETITNLAYRLPTAESRGGACESRQRIGCRGGESLVTTP